LIVISSIGIETATATVDEYDDYAYNDDDNDNNDYDPHVSSSSDKDEYNQYNNTLNIIYDMHGNQFYIDNNDNVIPYKYNDTSIDYPSCTTTNQCHPLRPHYR